MISQKKTYRTRAGQEVRIYAVDGGTGGSDGPIHGAVKQGTGWSIEWWDEAGRNLGTGEDSLDLIEVRPEREGWINVYASGGSDWMYSLSATREEADKKRDLSRERIACIYVKFREGDGIE